MRRMFVVWPLCVPCLAMRLSPTLCGRGSCQGTMTRSLERQLFSYMNPHRRNRFMIACAMAFFLVKGISCTGWIDRPGRRVACLSASAFHVIWGNDPRYWSWVSKRNSRFKEVAFLETVCWFDVRGQMVCKLSPGSYSLSWRIQMTDSTSQQRHRPLGFRVRNGYGWHHRPVKFSLLTGDGQQADSSRYLDGQFMPSERQLALSNLATVVDAGEGWLEYEVGVFVVDSTGIVDLQFSMNETDCSHWKSHLWLDGIAIRRLQLDRTP